MLENFNPWGLLSCLAVYTAFVVILTLAVRGFFEKGEGR